MGTKLRVARRLLQVKFGPNQAAITAMVSMEGECVELLAPVQITEAVEGWLGQLAGGMQGTLRQSLLQLAGMPDQFQHASSQVLCLYHAISFTAR